ACEQASSGPTRSRSSASSPTASSPHSRSSPTGSRRTSDRREPLMRLGLDLIEIERVRRALERHGTSFRDRCFTAAERAYCDGKPNPAQHYAGRFAAKEAVGTGVHFAWKEIEIAGRPKPGVRLSGRTALAAERLGATRIDVSMTHSRELAAAVAVVVES